MVDTFVIKLHRGEKFLEFGTLWAYDIPKGFEKSEIKYHSRLPAIAQKLIESKYRIKYLNFKFRLRY